MFYNLTHALAVIRDFKIPQRRRQRELHGRRRTGNRALRMSTLSQTDVGVTSTTPETRFLTSWPEREYNCQILLEILFIFRYLYPWLNFNCTLNDLEYIFLSFASQRHWNGFKTNIGKHMNSGKTGSWHFMYKQPKLKWKFWIEYRFTQSEIGSYILCCPFLSDQTFHGSPRKDAANFRMYLHRIIKELVFVDQGLGSKWQSPSIFE